MAECFEHIFLFLIFFTFVSGLYKAMVVFLNGLVNGKFTSLNTYPRYKSTAITIFVLRSVTESIAYSTPHTMNISPTLN